MSAYETGDMTREWCVDDRHGTPCPLPCAACGAECDDPAAVESASTWQEAARQAGWSEDYIVSQGGLGRVQPR